VPTVAGANSPSRGQVKLPHHCGGTGGRGDQVSRAFRRAALDLNVVLATTDADIMKTYVRAGLGIAIVTAKQIRLPS